ncbi:MAG: hypothetical protein H7Y43_13460 [Akkermansiaceae bacterium]|nr:hypothetical protein [Verrucomicrobiales bacterium]
MTVIFMTVREQHYQRFSLTKAGSWSRLFVAALFAGYLNYIPLHLATAKHWDGLLEAVAEVVVHHDGHGDADHSHDNDSHVPHPSSDHTLTFKAQTHASSVLSLAVFLQPLNSTILPVEPAVRLSSPVFERIWPPEDSPPDPLQPRAPPLA